MHTVSIGDTVISVDIADTVTSREQGLSERLNLSDGEGMLFIFDSEKVVGIWMKDMLFSIDVVWANDLGTIITIAHSVAPDTYPKVFYPAAPARYVVELPAGFAAAHSISEGSTIHILQNKK